MTADTKAAALADELEDACLLAGISRQEHLDHRIEAAALIRTQAARIAELEANPRATNFGREAEKLADDYLMLSSECAGLRERIAELEAERAGLVAAEREQWTEAVMSELDGNGQARAIVAYATRA